MRTAFFRGLDAFGGESGDVLFLIAAEETVCRIFTRFEEKSLISTERRLVRLGQMDRQR